MIVFDDSIFVYFDVNARDLMNVIFMLDGWEIGCFFIWEILIRYVGFYNFVAYVFIFLMLAVFFFRILSLNFGKRICSFKTLRAYCGW